jgi:hypothetical protein
MHASRLRHGASLIALCGAVVLTPAALQAQNPKTPPPPSVNPTPAKPKAAPATQKKPPAKPPAAAPKPSLPAKEAPAAPKPGLTMVTVYTGGDGASSETKLITNGQRQRIELGDGTAVITQCDTKQILQVNDKAKVYVSLPVDAPPVVAASPAKKTGVVDYTTTYTDTGEKKELHGLEARRVTTVVARTPTPTSCDKKKERVQTDGWYAAVPVTLMCAPRQLPPPPSADECRDEPNASSSGQPPTGSPLAYTVTTLNDAGKEMASARMEVKSLTAAPVDESLLAAPAGYTKAADPAAFVAEVERVENEARWSAPKAPGTIRIGVLMPTNKSGEDVSVIGIGNELLESLTVKPYEAVPILAPTPAEQATEAKSKEVDYVVALDLASLKTMNPSKVGGLMRKASGGGSPAELHEAKVEYRVFAAGSTTARATKNASAKSGSFTLKRAVGLARFAARLYFGASAGMFRTMMSTPAQNADPSLNAVSYVLNLMGSGTPAAADESSREATIITALHNASTDILKDLGQKKDK